MNPTAIAVGLGIAASASCSTPSPAPSTPPRPRRPHGKPLSEVEPRIAINQRQHPGTPPPFSKSPSPVPTTSPQYHRRRRQARHRDHLGGVPRLNGSTSPAPAMGAFDGVRSPSISCRHAPWSTLGSQLGDRVCTWDLERRSRDGVRASGNSGNRHPRRQRSASATVPRTSTPASHPGLRSCAVTGLHGH